MAATKDNVLDRIQHILNQFGNYSKERRIKNFISNRTKLRDAYKPIYFHLQSVSIYVQRCACKNIKLLKLLSYYGLHEEIEGLFGFIMDRLNANQPYMLRHSVDDLKDELPYLWLSEIALNSFEIFTIPFDQYPSYFAFRALCICTQHNTWDDPLLEHALLYTTFVSMFNTYLERNTSSVVGVLLSSWSDLLIGYFMVCTSEKIHHFMTDETAQKHVLNKSSNTFAAKFRKVKQHYDKINTRKKIQTFGISLFCESFKIMKEFKLPNPQIAKQTKFWHGCGISNQLMYYMCGVVYDYASMGNVSIKYLMLSAIQREDAFIRFLSLQRLSEVCSRNGYNLMGLKTLKSANRISSGHILCATETKIGVEDDMIDLDKRLRVKWIVSTCDNCGKRGSMKCCSGCFKANYCCKKCQAKHWKSTHRLTCSKQFTELYSQLKRRAL